VRRASYTAATSAGQQKKELILNDSVWQSRKITTATDPAFQELLRIYMEAHPASERKSAELLSRMLERPNYLFLVAIEKGVVIGFSITLCFSGCDACLLEYMAVDANRRNHGVGQFLFTEVTKRPELSGRFLLMEVDSDKKPTEDSVDRRRRKNFYRRLGCKEIEGLNYLMPQISVVTPPDMAILAFNKSMPASIELPMLRQWLQCCYVEVYGQGPNDPRIEHMLEKLPQNPRLI
jgi:ribosomal protein S18 acetylase RimI-like enzyme